MQVKIFLLYLHPTEEEMEELNHFPRAHKIIECRKEIAQYIGSTMWTFCITYLPSVVPLAQSSQQFSKGKKVYYKEVLYARPVRQRQNLQTDNGGGAFSELALLLESPNA